VTANAGQCPRPDCDGTIDSSGYCIKCGFAAESAPTPAAEVPAVPLICPRSGCEGPIDSDGYCTVDGLAGVPAATSGRAPGSPLPSAQPSTSRASRGNLGAGLVAIPPVPAQDPASAILADPQVAESQRLPTDSALTAATRIPSPPSFSRETSSAASTRYSGAWLTAGSAGSTWPGIAT